ncbi:hypothetical protein [Evansella tamaricis]|uniref:NADH dehydrogenase subunit 6 n=1 Tax=Evansella tamaricis TaxID=2069301 RepID=A0ABS6JCB0_9BACI|nr:hypothetical protein [Evansella tamaricis]MBU9711314.1 hypothetical protein [Evansella tamaricis]
MNRIKSYRIATLLLFFAFISLISRSIIYLILSLTVAFLIIILLSKEKKRKGDEPPRPRVKEKDMQRTMYLFPIFFTGIGFLMLSYGASGILDYNTVYHQLGWMVHETFLLLFFLFTGVFLFLYGITHFLKRWFSF